MLIESPLVISAVYLDPRYQRALKDKKSFAVNFLVGLYEYKKASAAIEIEQTCGNDSDGSYEELMDYLNTVDTAYMESDRTNASTDVHSVVKEKITKILNDFNGETLQLSEPILEC